LLSDRRRHVAILIRPFDDHDREAVVALWRRCGLVVSWNDPDRDITRKRSVQSDLFLVADAGDGVVGTAMAGYDGHRGWVNYLAVDPTMQRRGIGRLLMAAAEEGLRRLGSPKINVQIRRSNVIAARFYERIGFTEDDVISMGKRLEADGPGPAAPAPGPGAQGEDEA